MRKCIPRIRNLRPPLYSEYTPYEIDVKTERQMFVNDNGPTRSESTISTFSTYHPPPPPRPCYLRFPVEGAEFVEEIYGERRESFGEEALEHELSSISHMGRLKPRPESRN